MRDFLLGIVCLILFIGLIYGLRSLDLAYSPFETKMQTKITRASNSYVTTHQQLLRDFKSSYDAIDRNKLVTTDAAIRSAFDSQQAGILRQMHEEADLIPGEVQPDIQSLLSTHP